MEWLLGCEWLTFGSWHPGERCPLEQDLLLLIEINMASPPTDLHIASTAVCVKKQGKWQVGVRRERKVLVEDKASAN